MANQIVPSSSSSSNPPWTYDVFLSFRGDTRTNFTDHLYHALDRHGINTFIDHRELPTGEEISPTLLKAIENSRISVIVFSENYASSRWCLNELVHILECRKSKGQMIRPIFYKVDPSDVRNQKNSYDAAFADHSLKYKNDQEKVQRWRTALTEAANLKGATLNEGEYETTFINNIVAEISTQVLNRTYLHVAKDPVGIESCAKEVEVLLDVGGNDRRVVGIWGTSGIGKTTIAKDVYNAIARKFEGSCFLADVSETLASREGLIQLQQTLLSKFLCGADLNFVNAHEGINIIKNRLRRKKILVILDDVDKLERLKDWVDVDCFGEGSRVIITTKDRGLLDSYGVQLIYEVQKLEDDKALKLFSLNAFKRNRPPDDYLSLARRAIVYAQGLPLALNIIGSYLHNKSIGRWQAVLNSYDSYGGEPYTDIQIILRKTYDAWDYNLQQVFLDITCFFKGENEDYVLQMLRSSTLNVRQDIIDVLVEKAIIAIEDNQILMHDLLEKMGKHIVYEESPTEPGKRSRLWHHKDVCDVLIDCRGTKKIRGIVVNPPKLEVITLNAKSFSKMVNLEFFINRNAQFSGYINYLPNSLRLFDLSGRSIIIGIKHTVVLNLPSNFHPRHLVKFDVSYNGIRQLKGFKNLAKLTWMNLRGCKFLEKIPDLSGSPNIIKLDLSDCTSLVEVDDSVGFLNKLVKLDLSRCSNLTRFVTRLGLRSLEELYLHGCTRLGRFPEIEKDKMKSLTCLSIGESGIRELPSSIAYLTGLMIFNAYGCELQNVPDLSGCPNIRVLDLSDCTSLVEVDDSVGFLDKLEILVLSGCSKLTRFATRFGSRSLYSLSLGGCRRLESFPEIEGKMESLCYLDIEKSGIRELPSIAYFTSLRTLKASGCELQNIQFLPFGKKVKFDEVSSCISKLSLVLEGCNLSESDFLVPLDCWSALTELFLSRNNFVSLSDCFSKAVNLKRLFLRDCKRLREIPVLPPKLCRLNLDGCTSLEKIPKLPPSLEELNLCHCSGLSGDEVAKLENNLLNEEIYPHSRLSIIYPGNEVPKWFSYTSNHPTTIQPLPEYRNDEYERKYLFVGGSEYRFEIPIKLQVGETLLGLALSFVLEPPTRDFQISPIIINREKLFGLDLSDDESTCIKATHVRVALVGLGEQEQQGDICQVVFRFRKGCPIKSCGVHCLLRNQDELLHLSLRQQLLQRQDPMQFQGRNAQLQAMLQQQRLRQQQQILQSMPQLQRAQLQQQQQQQQILSWEFCARRHGQLLPRRLVAPQVNQLVQVAQKCQSTIAESGSDGISQQDLQTHSNMVQTAGRQLAKSLELQIYAIAISEVVNSMKDLVDFCRENKVGPIEGLKVYPRHATAAKLQMQKMQEMEQLASAQGLPTDRNTLNKLMALHPGLNNQMNNHHQMVGRGAMSGSAQAAYQNLLLRQNSMNSNANSLQQEASSSFNNSNHSPSSTFQGAAALIPGSMQNLPGSALSSPHLPSRQPQQLQQRSLSSNSLLQQTHSTGSQGNQALQQQMIQQLLQEMSNNSGGGGQQSLPSPSANGSVGRNGVSFGGNNPAAAPSTSNVSGSHGPAPSRNNSFKATANSDNSTGGGGNNTYNQRAPDLPSNLHLQEDLVQDIAREFTENGFFNSSLDDNMYGWKA